MSRSNDMLNSPLFALLLLKGAKLTTISMVHTGGKIVERGSVFKGSGIAALGSLSLCAFVALGLVHSSDHLKDSHKKARRVFHNNHPFYGKRVPYDCPEEISRPNESNTMRKNR